MGFEDFKIENKQPEKLEREEKQERDERLGFESMEQREVIENFLDHSILSNYKKIDEGHNGIIGLVDLVDLQKEYLELVEEAQISGMDISEEKLMNVFQERFGELLETDDKMAAKMLKIFSVEKASHEAAVQTKMYDLIEKAKLDNPDKKYASTPKIYFNRSVDLRLHPELKEKINHDDVHIDEKVNVMSMDFLRGENYDYYVHKEALLARGFSEEECDGKDYRWMQLQLSSLGIKGFAVGMDDAGFKLEDTKQLNKNNIEALSKFLANVPERAMPKEVFEKVRNTLDLAHEHNVFHRDLHERNLFLHLNEARELIDVSIIDWGESKILSEISGLKESEKKQLVYGDRTGAHLDDDYILKYEKLLISDEELAQKEKEEFMTEISQSLQIIKERAANPDELKTNPKLKAYEKLIEEIEYLTENEAEDKDFIENLDRELGNFSSLMISDPAADLQQFRLKLALWLDVIKGEHGAAVDENKVAEYLEQNKSSKLYIEKDKESFVKYLKEKAEQ
jgi:hypothetical protein